MSGIARASSSCHSGPTITTARIELVKPIPTNSPLPTTPPKPDRYEQYRTLTQSVTHRDAKKPANSN
jgi:hypothetical protein